MAPFFTKHKNVLPGIFGRATWRALSDITRASFRGCQDGNLVFMDGKRRWACASCPIKRFYYHRFFILVFINRGHATLELAVSVCRSVCRSVSDISVFRSCLPVRDWGECIRPYSLSESRKLSYHFSNGNSWTSRGMNKNTGFEVGKQNKKVRISQTGKKPIQSWLGQWTALCLEYWK